LDRLDEEWPNLRQSLHWHLDEGHTSRRDITTLARVLRSRLEAAADMRYLI
jgi:hypothetical protein